MTEFGLLGSEVFFGAVGWGDLDRHSFDHLDSSRLESFEFLRIVRHEPHTGDAEVPEHGGAQRVIPVIGFKSELMIRLDGVVTRILKLIRKEFVHQADAAPFLELINQDSRSHVRNALQREFKLLATIASFRPEDVAGQALGMDANERRVLHAGLTHDESDNIVRLVLRLESE